jgi:peptidylprolyl isomerase
MSFRAPASAPVRAARGLAVLLLSSTLVLTACGGSDSKDSTDTASQGNSGSSSDTSGSTGGSDSAGGSDMTPSLPTPSAAPKGSKAESGLPAVANATDMKKQPVISKATGTAPTGVVTRDLVVGKGDVVKASDTATLQYVGALYVNGKVFDSSWGRGQPLTLGVSQFVPGFSAGLIGMKIGGRREIVIPAEYGYGAMAQDGIPANSVLVFVVDMISIGGAQ